MKKILLIVVIVLFVVNFLTSAAFSQEAAQAMSPAKRQIEKDAVAKVLKETQFNFAMESTTTCLIIFDGKPYRFTLPSFIEFKNCARPLAYTEYWAFAPYDPSLAGNLLSHPERRLHIMVFYEVPEHSACGAVEKAKSLNRMIVEHHKQAEATLSQPLSVLTNAFSKGLNKSKGNWTKVSEEDFEKYKKLRQEWLVAHPESLPSSQVATTTK